MNFVARHLLFPLLLLSAPSPAFTQTARYELFPEPDVRQTSASRTSTAYVVDKKANQFWVCTAGYEYKDLTSNNGDCAALPLDVGRPSLNEGYVARAMTGSAPMSALLPVFWFIEPNSGAIQFYAGACVQLKLP